ncbi:hypothetical protein D3C84_492250 [compost metagenome]
MAAQRLDRMGQAVEGMGAEQQAIEQQGVGRHRGIAQAGALHGDQEEHQLQGQGADEDVAVHRQQRSPARPAAQRRPVDPPGITLQGAARQVQAEQRATPFGDHRSPGRPGHAPVQTEDEQQIQRHIEQVGGQQDRQRPAGVLGAEQPADQGVAGQRRGQAEQADLQVTAGQRIELRRGLHQAQRRRAERQRQQDQQHGQQRAEQQALQQHLAQCAAVLPAGGLGGEAGGAHAQETHGPGQQGVQATADRHCRQLLGMRQMTDHRAVDQGHQRHRQVGQNHRRSQRPDPFVGGRVLPGCEQCGHGDSGKTPIIDKGGFDSAVSTMPAAL